ncbi:MAG: glycosyltransferase [Paramuribaculum sp.]|nr:glycosyltransferase [Paramuribaculum sp.]
MKVALVCHSDLLGGASVVTYRLMQALRHRGVDARMIVYSRLSDDDNVILVGSRFVRGIKFMTERLKIFLSNGLKYDNLFKVSIANTGYPLHLHPWVKEADVVALNWVNQGLMSLKGVESLASTGKPIVWTMHDMWNCTGICHHAYECPRYEDECGMCPLLGAVKENDLSRKVWFKKKALYDKVPIHFVAVSNWLAGQCAKSGLLSGRDVRVIPNAFPVDTFSTELSGDSPMLNIDFNRDLIVMGAARLDDPIKGLDYAIDALNFIFDNNPAVAKKTTAVFFGDMRNSAAFDRLRFPYTWVGRINDPTTVRGLYAAAKVVLSTSLYETLPGTLIEGQAAGCLPVTFGRGGQSDIVTHLKDGYIAEYKSVEDIAKGLCWALAQEPDKKALHESVRERFASSEVARRYIELFDEITNSKK